MNNKQINNTKKRKSGKYYNLYFLGVVVVLYIILFLLNPKRAYDSLRVSGKIFVSLILVLLIVILFMGLLNYFLKPKAIAKHLGKRSGIKGWFLASLTGILSLGPIYIWYPLMKELRGHGMRSGLLAVFLYNRAIKVPLLPVMIHYFGIDYTVVLTIFMIIASLIEGKIIEITEYYIKI